MQGLYRCSGEEVMENRINEALSTEFRIVLQGKGAEI